MVGMQSFQYVLYKSRNEMVLSIYLIDVACGTESQVLHEELQPSLNDVFGGYSKQLQIHLVPFE